MQADALRQLHRLGGARGVRRRGRCCGARLAHSLRRPDRRARGTARRPPRARRPARPRLDRLDGLRQHGRHAAARPRAQPGRARPPTLLVDIACQLRRPTGHAVNPVPLTEAERIPSADENVEVQLIAHELEREARRVAPTCFDWRRLERLGADLAEYGERFRDRALALPSRRRRRRRPTPPRVLLAMRRHRRRRRSSSASTCAAGGRRAARAVEGRADVAASARGSTARLPRLDGMRIVLAVLDVHDVVRDALALALPRAGAR